MFRKNKKLILLTSVLAVLTLWFVLQNKSGTVKEALRDFAVKDTAAISKIFIADRAGNTIELERERNASGAATGMWRLNKKYYARKDAISTLLETLYKVDMKNYVAKTAYNTIVRQLSTTGIKCEVYLNGKEKPAKVFYVGGSTQDTKGTFMILENSSVPFVTEIPGFDGYLTPRFFTKEIEWRWKNVFDITADEISAVTVNYNPDMNRSFRIEYRSVNDFTVTSPATGVRIAQPDTAKVVNYVSQFTDVNFEFFDFMMNQPQRDSILEHKPQGEIIVAGKNGKEKRVKFYPVPVTSLSIARTDTTGADAKYDVDRLYAFVNNDSDLVGVQVFVFGKFFRALSDFDAAANLKRN